MKFKQLISTILAGTFLFSSMVCPSAFAAENPVSVSAENNLTKKNRWFDNHKYSFS